jgi:DNA-binding MarR family transcriptional regulator
MKNARPGPGNTPVRNPVDPISHIPARLLTLTSKIALHATRTAARPLGMSIREWRIIQILGANGPSTINEAASSIAMDFGGTSRAITTLEGKGLVHRLSDEDDRRVSRVELTEQGRKIHNEIAVFAHEREKKLLSRFKPEDQKEFERLLTLLDASVAELLAEDTKRK